MNHFTSSHPDYKLIVDIVENNDLVQLNEYITQNNVDIKSVFYYEILEACVSCNALNLVTYMCKPNPGILRPQVRPGWPFSNIDHVAIITRANTKEMIELLMDLGTDINDIGRACIHSVNKWSPLMNSIYSHKSMKEHIKLLIQFGCEIFTEVMSDPNGKYIVRILPKRDNYKLEEEDYITGLYGSFRGKDYFQKVNKNDN